MNTTIKITTIEEARKWVGRKAGVSFGTAGDTKPLGFGYICATLATPRAVAEGFVFGGSFGGPECAIWIELLDGPAHPRPEGEGWTWCQTAEDAKPFVGKICNIDAVSESGTRGLSSAVLQRVHSLGGAWIRPFTLDDVDPADAVQVAHEARLRHAMQLEREAPSEVVDPVAVAHAACAEAWDLAEAARAESDRLTEVLREVKAAARLRKQREAEDARFPLREGWAWGKYANYAGIAAISQKQGHPCGVFVDPDGDLRQVWEHSGSAYRDTYAPVDVARAVIARYDATRANT